MEQGSDLADLYVALYGQMPSSHTASDLMRLERFFQLSKDDPFAQMQVVLLRAADRIGEQADRRTEEEKRFVTELNSHTRSLRHLTGAVEETRWRVVRKARRTRYQLADDEIVPVDRSVSPLFRYLAYAFYRRIGPPGDDERIVAARQDLFGVTMLLIFFLGVAVMLGKAL